MMGEVIGNMKSISIFNDVAVSHKEVVDGGEEDITFPFHCMGVVNWELVPCRRQIAVIK